MNVFVLGHTQSGKSTLAQHIADKYGFKHIEASGNLRDLVPRNEGESDIDYVKRLSNKSKELLLKDPYYFADIVKSKMQPDRNIISGIRNPVDLIQIADFKKDLIIFITPYKGNFFGYHSAFERTGLYCIQAFIPFLTDYINPNGYFCYHNDPEKTIEENFDSNIWEKKYLYEHFN